MCNISRALSVQRNYSGVSDDSIFDTEVEDCSTTFVLIKDAKKTTNVPGGAGILSYGIYCQVCRHHLILYNLFQTHRAAMLAY
ncbi:hypothetical protein TRIUR3_30132 [Triticum urartu]|uniref:Uncharacterized protein n=1 Tax=Triticum urartu TaxID=4572 RepID=M8ABB6_TRIUA|nr:hypothetical protein TRIUR3_30132 [Triticum urartu]